MGEFLVLIGTFVAHRWWAVVATAGVVIAAVYLLWAYQQAFHGEPEPEDTKTRDLGWNERLIVAPLMVLIVVLGVYPKPVLDRITPSVNQLVVHVDRVTNTSRAGQPGAAGGQARRSHPVPRPAAGLRPATARRHRPSTGAVMPALPLTASAAPTIHVPHIRLPEHPAHADHDGRGPAAA